MSKLAKAIEATLTGDVKAARALKLNYTDCTFDVNEPVHRLSKEVLLRVKLEKKVWLDERHDTNIVYHDIKRAMVEEIFGEFRPRLIEIRGALYDEDTVRARTLLAEMEDVMFRDGL